MLYQEDLSIGDIAGAIGTTRESVQGFYGPEPKASYNVCQDEFASWEDYGSWAVDELNGIYSYSIARGYERFQLVGETVPKALIEAWDRIWDIAHDIEYTERVMTRYAALHGYTLRTVSLRGSTQGEWAECVIFETAQEQGTVNENYINDIFAGEIYSVEVSLEGPGGEEVSTNIGGIVGYDEVSLLVSALILEAHREIIWNRAA